VEVLEMFLAVIIQAEIVSEVSTVLGGLGDLFF